jgi:hypothetical protein
MNMEMGYAYRMHSDMTVKAIWDHWRTLSLLIAAFLVVGGGFRAFGVAIPARNGS